MSDLLIDFMIHVLFTNYRKACNDILELVEESLDVDLFASKVKFRFTESAILGGVSIHETQGFVVVLVSTVASVHRLVFPHPSRLHNNVSK